MVVLEILRDKEHLFIEDNIESPKVKKLVKEINDSLISMNEEMWSFGKFKSSQLDGEYNKTLVLVKSLKKYLAGWKPIEMVFNNYKMEERQKIDSYLAKKNRLLSGLKFLQKEVKKTPVVSCFDFDKNLFIKCEPGREIVILGDRNIKIIEGLIRDLDKVLVATGHFDELIEIDLSPDYSKIMQNVKLCTDKLYELYSSNQSKTSKLNSSIESMKDSAKKVVFFAHYKNQLKTIGCSDRDLDSYEKQVVRDYLGYKQLLERELQTQLQEICKNI